MKHYSSTAVDRSAVEAIDAKQTAQIKKIYKVIGVGFSIQLAINIALLIALL